MARSSKYNKNLQKVQDMLDGNHKNKIQVGYSSQDEKREDQKQKNPKKHISETCNGVGVNKTF